MSSGIRKLTTKEECLELIADASILGNLVLFIGAGFSKAVYQDFSDDYTKPMSWTTLIDKLCELNSVNISEDEKKYKSCPEVTSLLCKKIAISGMSYEEALNKVKEQTCTLVNCYLNANQISDWYDILSELNPRCIVTTNYDLILEQIFGVKALSLSQNEALTFSHDKCPIYHLHGIITDPNNIVLDQSDYVKLFRPNEYRADKLSTLMKESIVLFLGYQIGDINVQSALDFGENVYTIDTNNFFENNYLLLDYTASPSAIPSQDASGVNILEMSNMIDCLKEFRQKVLLKKEEEKQRKESFENTRNKILSLGFQNIVNNSSILNDFITITNNNGTFEGIELANSIITQAFDSAYKQTRPNMAFSYYKEYLQLFLILLNGFKDDINPLIFSCLMRQLSRIVPSIGHNCGQGYSAAELWESEKGNIDNIKKQKMITYAKTCDLSLIDFLCF